MIPKIIAFYLPQFHPIPENDEWWGKGFTEWRNVVQARPRFVGHYQPHIPADLGFYDLRLPEIREAQAAMARSYGIYGFCYFHYWFNGHRLLHRPFDEVLNSGKPDFPFCLCWANENWNRAWDGLETEVLIRQAYTFEDDQAHIRALLPALSDRRYIRVDGRPLLIIYRAARLPDPKRTTDIWRAEAVRAGIGDLMLCRVDFPADQGIDPKAAGFDAAVEFQPFGADLGPAKCPTRLNRILSKAGLTKKYPPNGDMIFDYSWFVQHSLRNTVPPYRRFPCVTPSWDNSARRARNAFMFRDSSPEIYGDWLAEVVRRERARTEEPVVFINAWNEWAEGNHLEPDLVFGHRYLEATRRAVRDDRSASA
jgi:lipopolysaccharide biosynthesis protein